MADVEVKTGQVWVETVVPKEGGSSWERIHFVHAVKHLWMADNKYFYVSSSTNEGALETALDKFRLFRKTDLIVGANTPCIEQRTIDELEQMIAGTYSPQVPSDKIKDAAIGLLQLIGSVASVGGHDRQAAIERAILALRDVAAFCGEDVKGLDREIWIKRLR
jgi:hypothetical protein